MHTIDGSEGEGGGQILRTSLAFGLVAREPVRVTRIRAKRPRRGLLRQHLTALRAAAAVGDAEVTGDALGSEEITFRPRALVTGEHRFAVGSAGSTSLVLQTVLPALLLAPARSTIVLEGGTHNRFAPPFDFVERSFLPLIERLGPHVEMRLERPGFYPAGGGVAHVTVIPAARLTPFDLLERGALVSRRVVASVADLPGEIAKRELAAAAGVLGWEPDAYAIHSFPRGCGPGNVVVVTMAYEHVTEVVTAFGERGVRSEVVGEWAAREAAHYVEAGVPVGEHLADQLVLPLALAGRGSFRTLKPSGHTTTQVELVRQLTGTSIQIDDEGDGVFRVHVG